MQHTAALLNQPAAARLDADALCAAALLHDIGKVDGPAGHEERSYRLLVEALPPDWPPAGLVLPLVRHHAALGLVQTGEASALALRSLLADVRRSALPPELFLAHLLLLTRADWLAYELLTPRAEAGLRALAESLSEPGWWRSPSAEVEARLWRLALDDTAERLHHLLNFAYLQPQSAPEAPFGAIARAAVEQRGLRWPDFARRFARLAFDGGYSVFWRCRHLLDDEAARLDFVLPHLLRWLPPDSPAPGGPLLSLNLRPLAANLPAMSLPQLDAALGRVKLS
jgi:hypothetical protein